MYVLRSDVPEITNADLLRVARALGWVATTHFGLEWNLVPSLIDTAEGSPTPPPGSIIATVVADLQESDAIAFHAIDASDRKYIEIGWNVIKQNGGDKFAGPSDAPALALSVAISHEYFEAEIDGACNEWVARDDTTEVAKEVCDPVESSVFIVELEDSCGTTITPIAFSNYVLPAWFDPLSPAGTKLDHIGDVATSPLQIAPGGYLVKRATAAAQNTEQAKREPPLHAGREAVLAWAREQRIIQLAISFEGPVSDRPRHRRVKRLSGLDAVPVRHLDWTSDKLAPTSIVRGGGAAQR